MPHAPQKVVGILGGMGPMSTADLFIRIVDATPVSREQDHLRILVDNNPKIPDRTAALRSGDTASVRQALCETARNLERAGAELIGMPCNTAHAFLADIRASVDVPVLDMVGEAAGRARELFGARAVAGLLATDGTLSAGLYGEALERHGLATTRPRAEPQAIVMGVIDEVKVRGVSVACSERLERAVDDLAAQGTTILIAACTEISLVLSRHPPVLPWLDPLQVLADALVTRGTGQPPGV